jgi:acetoacetyl-CoA synthetase
MPLFVVLRENVEMDDGLKARIREGLRKGISPHHVPDEVLVIPEVPRTLSGKKLEVPVKKLLMGIPIEKAISTDAMSNPHSIQYFIEIADRIKPMREVR